MEYSIAEILSSRKSLILHIDGYLYSKNSGFYRCYWRCRKRITCPARAITEGDGEFLVIIKGPNLSPHNHAPNYEAAEIQRELHRIKRKSAEYHEIIRELNARGKDSNTRSEPASNRTENSRPNIEQNCPRLKESFNCRIPILDALKDMEKWDQPKKN